MYSFIDGIIYMSQPTYLFYSSLKEYAFWHDSVFLPCKVAYTVNIKSV